MGSALLTLDHVECEGRRVFVRVDFNVPLDDGRVTDDTRIKAALPTLLALLEKGGSLVVASHLGRPGGEEKEDLRMAPVAEKLRELLGGMAEVVVAQDVAGRDSRSKAEALQPGQVLLLENLRFEPGEIENDPTFAAALAGLADLFVQDAFGACHRAHASTSGLPGLLKPAVAGRLLEKEIAAFASVFDSPAPPVVAVVGGAKVSDKIQVLESLLEKVDRLLIGGGMAYTFLASRGKPTGNSLVEEDHLETARVVTSKAEESGVESLLPCDHVAADRFAADADTREVEDVPDGWMGLDIGSATRTLYAEALADAGTVVWNGPMGVFEMEAFRGGTAAVARALADSDAVSVVGGGDSVAAVKGEGLEDRIHHLSTGGGAFLAMLEGRALPGIAALDTTP